MPNKVGGSHFSLRKIQEVRYAPMTMASQNPTQSQLTAGIDVTDRQQWSVDENKWGIQAAIALARKKHPSSRFGATR